MSERTYGGHTLAMIRDDLKKSRTLFATQWPHIIEDLIAAAEDYESLVKLANENADRVALANQHIDQLRALLNDELERKKVIQQHNDQLRAENERLRTHHQAIIDQQPCTEGGGCFYPMHDVEGNYIGEQNVDPLGVIQAMVEEARRALEGE